MRKAEAGLIALARRFGDDDSSSYKMELFDTHIPASVLPFRKPSTGSIWNIFGGGITSEESEEKLTMHAIRVTKETWERKPSTKSSLSQQQYPLVIVHGYMNGALYFYRNLAGLANFFDTVISVDLLGWGLSSRPSFDRLKDDTVETAEDFFVESLESWRSTNNIEKMNLAGHSMGGYLSVAYCEKYPERVDKLLLLSPAGIPEESPGQLERRARFLNSYPRKLAYSFFSGLWDGGYTPGSVMRTIPESQGRRLVEGYIHNRLPAIRDPEEQAILAEYMYTGSILPGSGEYGLSRLLHPGAMAKKPCLHRIPKLKVKDVSFFYGLHDWMDVEGALDVQSICREQRSQEGNLSTPNINVYQITNAGHLLMLENSKSFNAALMVDAGLDPSMISESADLPIVPEPKTVAPLGVEKFSKRRESGGEGESGSVQVTA